MQPHRTRPLTSGSAQGDKRKKKQRTGAAEGSKASADAARQRGEEREKCEQVQTLLTLRLFPLVLTLCHVNEANEQLLEDGTVTLLELAEADPWYVLGPESPLACSDEERHEVGTCSGGEIMAKS